MAAHGARYEARLTMDVQNERAFGAAPEIPDLQGLRHCYSAAACKVR
jgi:hypothetical protein